MIRNIFDAKKDVSSAKLTIEEVTFVDVSHQNQEQKRAKYSTQQHTTNDRNDTATSTADSENMIPVTEKVVKSYAWRSNYIQIP